VIREQLRKQMQNAMKEKNDAVRDYAKVVLSEFSRYGKDIEDDEAVRIIKKLTKSEEENIEMSGKKDRGYLDFLQFYFPQQASEEEIKDWIMMNVDFSSLKNKMQAVGIVVKHFGTKADGKLISSIIQTF